MQQNGDGFWRQSRGVYMLFFERQLQYIWSSANLHERIRSNLLSGNSVRLANVIKPLDIVGN